MENSLHGTTWQENVRYLATKYIPFPCHLEYQTVVNTDKLSSGGDCNSYKDDDYSDAYSAKDLRLRWHKTAILINDGFAISGYEYCGANHEELLLNYTMGDEKLQWDNIVVRLALRRNLPYYIYRIYVPCILLMIFTVGSYWLPSTEDDSGRVGLIVTTFLAMIFVLQSVTEEVAKTSTATSLHIFVIVNIVFIVVSIIEYIMVAKTSPRSRYFDRIRFFFKALLKRNKMEKSNDLSLHERNNAAADMEDAAKGLVASNTATTSEAATEEVHFLDRICRYVMPLLYLIFLVTHFGHYMSIDKSYHSNH